MTAQVVGIRYCEEDPETYTAHLTLLLTLMNDTDHNIIVHRNREKIEILAGEIASDLRNLSDHKYENFFTYDAFVNPKRLPKMQGFDSAHFVLIPPKGRYAFRGAAALVVRAVSNDRIAGTISSGKHVMAGRVWNWPYSDEAGKELQKRWKNYGEVIYRPLHSDPFQFTIPSAVTLTDCSAHPDR